MIQETWIECSVLLFDLDGVLIDSTVCITRHWRDWALSHRLDLQAILDCAHGRRTAETMRLVAPFLDVEAEAAEFARHEAADTDGVAPIEGALDVLHSLPDGCWAVVTSGGWKVATARMRSQGLPLPQVMVTAEDVINGKPNPEPYLVAAARMGVPPRECVVVEDSPAGITSAKSAGMCALAVATTHTADELSAADAVAPQLQNVRVEQVPSGRLRIAVRR